MHDDMGEGGCEVVPFRVDFPERLRTLSLAPALDVHVADHHATLDAAFGWDMTDEPADKLPLASVTTIDDIESFRRSTHPMCRYCANDRMGITEWGRSRRDEQEWRA